MDHHSDHAVGGMHTLPTDTTAQRLLRSTVELGRWVFNAAAASVFLVDSETSDLVFAAVSGEGENELLGTRFPAQTGIAGWVAESCEPMLADNVSETSQFDTAVAETTGYVPRSIMAAPLIRDETCIGVLEILDRGTRLHEELHDVNLLGLLSNQAAIGLELFTRLRSASVAANIADAELIAGIIERLAAVPKPTAERARRLLVVVHDMLAADVYTGRDPAGGEAGGVESRVGRGEPGSLGDG
jgi:GAF domain-containing protein